MFVRRGIESLLVRRCRVNSVQVAAFSSKPLSEDEKVTALTELNESNNTLSSWKVTDDGRDAIKKLFEFSNFSQAWSFMSKCCHVAEKVRFIFIITSYLLC